MLSVEHSVGLQVFDPDLLGVVEDAASFDADRAGSCVEKQESVNASHTLDLWKDNVKKQMYQHSFQVSGSWRLLLHANLPCNINTGPDVKSNHVNADSALKLLFCFLEFSVCLYFCILCFILTIPYTRMLVFFSEGECHDNFYF